MFPEAGVESTLKFWSAKRRRDQFPSCPPFSLFLLSSNPHLKYNIASIVFCHVLVSSLSVVAFDQVMPIQRIYERTHTFPIIVAPSTAYRAFDPSSAPCLLLMHSYTPYALRSCRLHSFFPLYTELLRQTILHRLLELLRMYLPMNCPWSAWPVSYSILCIGLRIRSFVSRIVGDDAIHC